MPSIRSQTYKRNIQLGVKERRKKVAELLITQPNLSRRDLSDLMNVSVNTIYGDIKAIEKEYISEYTDDVKVAKRRVIKRLNYIFSEAKLAWDKSKLEQVSIKKKEKVSTGGKAGGSVDTEKVEDIKKSPGDPRFLDQMKNTAIEIAKYEGVDKLEGISKLEVEIKMPDLPAEYSQFGLTPDIPEEDHKEFPEDNAKDAIIIEDDDE